MNFKIKKLSIIAFLAAISSVLMTLNFPIILAPSFMKMDLSELPIIIGGFILGPIESVIIAILKVLVKFVLKPSTSTYIGELANLIGSVSYVLPASIIYNKLKTKRRAIYGMALGVVLASVICTISNKLFIFPMYMKLYEMTESSIIKMCSAIMPFIDNMNKVYLYSVLPFNVIKYLITTIITYFLYKKISIQIKNILG